MGAQLAWRLCWGMPHYMTDMPLILCKRSSSAGTLSANRRRQCLAAATPCRSACPACPSCWLPALPLQPLWRRGTPAHGARRWPRSSPPHHTTSLRACCPRWQTAWRLRVSADVTLATLSACTASSASLLGPSCCRYGVLCSRKCRLAAWRHILLDLHCKCQLPSPCPCALQACRTLPRCAASAAATWTRRCGSGARRLWARTVRRPAWMPWRCVEALLWFLVGWQYWAGEAQAGWCPAWMLWRCESGLWRLALVALPGEEQALVYICASPPSTSVACRRTSVTRTFYPKELPTRTTCRA